LRLSQDFKVPHLRNIYQKRHFTRSATAVSLSGFGLVHDGSDPDFFTFFSHPVFGTFAGDTTRKRNLSAFMHCFETGTAPAVGYTRSVHAGNVAAAGPEWAVLEAQATGASATIDVVVRLLVEGRRRAFLYRPATNDYLSDQTGYGPLPRSGLAALVVNGASGFVMGVPRLSGTRLAIDRDGDTVPDGDEPIAAPAVSRAGGVAAAAWSALDPQLVLEWTDSLTAPDWRPVLEPRATAAGQVSVADPTAGARRFYRLRQP
jgi:hypothetical protein